MQDACLEFRLKKTATLLKNKTILAKMGPDPDLLDNPNYKKYGRAPAPPIYILQKYEKNAKEVVEKIDMILKKIN